MTDSIAYRTGYKYQLAYDYVLKISIEPAKDIETDYILLSRGGELTVIAGYAWDGVSGPVIDTRRNLRASLVHDALYQLMRCGELIAVTTKIQPINCFEPFGKQDGVPSLLAQVYYETLKRLGKPSTRRRVSGWYCTRHQLNDHAYPIKKAD